MLKCPKCNHEMNDGAKFCSECATPLAAALPNNEMDIKTQESAESTKTFAEESVQIQEKSAAEAPKRRGSSRKGVFICMLLAIAAVVGMYIFYDDLGFDKKEADASNVILYVKDGELYYNDLDSGSEYQVTRDLAGAIENNTDLMLAVRLSTDGKTLFYPDRMGAGCEGYSLYCTTIGSDALPVKLGNDITWYDISDDGELVYYITVNGDMYRHDLNAKTKIDKAVKTLIVSNDGSTAVYLLDDGSLYLIKENQPSGKIASGVSDYYTYGSLQYVYYTCDDGFYCFNGSTSEKFGSSDATLVSSCGNMAVLADENEYSLLIGAIKYELDCGGNTSDFRFASSGDKLFYLESVGGDTAGKDAYCVQIKDGKPGAAVLCDTDVVGITTTKNALVCLKDAVDETGDLYINGKCFGYSVSRDKISGDGEDSVAFLADCDALGGTLSVYNGEKAVSVRTDVSMFTYTEKGSLVFLCDIGQSSEAGDLFRWEDGEIKPITHGVTCLFVPLRFK